MTDTTTTEQYALASTPDNTSLRTVGPVPFDTHTRAYESMHGVLGQAGADAIISEIWRLTRNERFLEIELEVRGHMVPDLQLTSIAINHVEDGVLDPTAAARQFITTVRNEYPHQLSTPDADAATAAQTTAKTASPR